VSKEVVDIYHQVSVRLPTCIRNQNPAASFRTRIMWVTPTPFPQEAFASQYPPPL
jgi:hypothetical protein